MSTNFRLLDYVRIKDPTSPYNGRKGLIKTVGPTYLYGVKVAGQYLDFDGNMLELAFKIGDIVTINRPASMIHKRPGSRFHKKKGMLTKQITSKSWYVTFDCGSVKRMNCIDFEEYNTDQLAKSIEPMQKHNECSFTILVRGFRFDEMQCACGKSRPFDVTKDAA